MSDIELRVDKAFSSAVEHQLDEQREIRRLVARVDETLIALSDGMVDLAGQLDTAAQRIGGVAATPEDVEQARAEVVEHVGRIGAAVSELERDLAEQIGEGGRGAQSLMALVSDTRADLLDALARLERESAPVAEAVEDTRREVVGALRQISDMIDQQRDEAWTEAVARLDAVIAQGSAGQLQDRQAIAEALTTWHDQATTAIQQLQEHAADALRDAAAKTAQDVASRDVTRLDEIARDVTATSAEVAAQVAGSTAALGERVETTGRTVLDQVMGVAADVASRHDDLLARLESVAALAADVAPANRAGLEDVAVRLADLVRDQREDSVAALEQLAATRGATPAEVGELVDGLAAHMDAAVGRRLGNVVGHAADATAAMTTATERLEQATTSHGSQVEDLGARILARLDASATASVTAVEAAADRLAEQARAATEQARAATEQAFTSLVESQTAASTQMREASDSLTTVARALEPSVGAALEDLRTALLEQSQGNRSDVDRAIASLAEASTAARDGVLGAVGRATARLAEVQAEGIGRMTAVADHLDAVPESISPPILAAVEQMQTGVADAVSHLRQATAEATQAAVQALAQSTSEAQRDLAANLASASDDVSVSWNRLVEVQAEEAQRLEQASSALALLGRDLEPGVRQALDEVRAALQADLQSQRAESSSLLGGIAGRAESAADGITRALEGSTSALESQIASASTALSEEVSGATSVLRDEVSGATSVLRDEVSGVRSALQQEISGATAALRDEVSGATTGLEQGVAGVTARMEAQLSAATDTLGAASVEASGLVREAAEASGEALRQAAEAAASRVEASQTDGLLALTTATNRLQTVNDDIPQVMTATRAGLLEALSAAREEIAALLARTDEHTSARITELVDSASQAWLAKVDQQGQALDARTEQVLAATAGITPAVDDLITRMRSEVAVVATGVLADLQAPVVEAGRVAAEMQPALGALVANLQIALEQAAAGSATRSSEVATEARDMLLEAIALVQRELTDEVSRTEASVQEAAQAIAVANRHGEEELRAAAAALTEVAGRLEPGVAAVVADLQQQLLSRVEQDAEQTSTRLRTLQEALDTTTAALQSQVETATGASDEVMRELETVSSRTRATIEEGLAAARSQLAATMDAQLAALADHLSAAGSDAALQTEALQQATARMTVGVDAALVTIAAQVKQSTDAAEQHVVQAAESLVTRLESHSATLREELTTLLADAASRADTAAAQGERTSNDLVNISAEVVETMQAAVADLAGNLSGAEATLAARLHDLMAETVRQTAAQVDRIDDGIDRVDGRLDAMVESVRTELDSSMRRNAVELERQTGSLIAHMQRVEGLEVASADRVENLVQDVTSRLTGELMMTRDAVRSAASNDTETASQAVAAISSQVDRVLADVPAQVRVLLSEGLSAQGSLLDHQEVIDQRMEAMEQRLVLAMQAARNESDVRHQEELRAAERRLADVTARLEQAERVATQGLGHADAALSDLRRGTRADADALLDALAVRADEVLSALTDRAEGLLSGLSTPPAETAAARELVAGLDQAIGRMQQTTAHLEQLGPRLERQSSTRVEDVVERVLGAIAELSRALQRVEHLDRSVDEAMRRGLADLRRSVSAAAPGGYPAPQPARGFLSTSAAPAAQAQPGTSPEASHGRATVPPAPRAVAETVCPDCGFVARTPPGLVAHRRTCEAAGRG